MMNSTNITFTLLLLTILRYLLAGLFIVAALQKIPHPKQFVEAVRAYQVLPRFAVAPFGILLPWVELGLGMMLLIGWYTKPVAVLTGLLYAAFTLALGINLFRGRKNIDCGCFGPKQKHRITPWLVARDIGLALAAGVVAIWGGGSFTFETLPSEAQGLLAQGLLEYGLPTTLVFVGMIVAWKLLRQTLRLVYLSTKEGSK